MANPTTNYGFVLPTSSDLVTDLPADFDVALQGVDTRLKALQPGTTLGDLAYTSATANTNTRLGIGSNGQFLTVAAGVPAWGNSPAYAWTTWSPTLTALTVGNGTQTARYVQIDKLVIAQYKLVFGSTSAVTGAIEVTLPVTAANTSFAGTGLFIDGGASYYLSNITAISTTKFGMGAAYASPYVFTLNTSSTVPFTWATTDTIQVTIIYEAA